jgi:hypothetical protein
MSYCEELLGQAKHLATREPGTPKQVSLRRSISAAYYALFHFLVDEGAKMLVDDEGLRALVQRCFNHNEMKDACRALLQKRLPHSFGEAPPDLARVAEAFIELQEKRHSAEYDLTEPFLRTQALELIVQAENAIAVWQTIRHLPITKAFLASFIFGKRWNR